VWSNLDIVSGGQIDWVFPKAFVALPVVTATAGGTSDPRIVTLGTPSTTQVTIFGRTTAGLNWNGNVRAMAVGRWY
jgi:hypothetical protein